MSWMGIGVTLVVSIVVVALIAAKRSVDELGSVSDHWIAEHRADSR